jgi:hypothetical protein
MFYPIPDVCDNVVGTPVYVTKRILKIRIFVVRNESFQRGAATYITPPKDFT